jgi:TldD protein
MNEQLRRALDVMEVDYADLRFEDNRKTSIRYEGQDLRQIASYTTSGGHVRAYAGGGKALGSFSHLEDAVRIAGETGIAARHAAEHRDRPLTLADAPPVVGEYLLEPQHDPRTISLAEKHDLVEHYNRMILAAPGVATSVCEYDEFASRRVFVNSEC